MQPFELLFMLSTSISLVSSIPQARQLIITKRSDELSLPTWIVWFGSMIISLLYAISLSQLTLILAYIGWATFYGVMVGLIIHYRRATCSNQQTISAFDNIE